jgi:hypothetical protein
LMEAILFVPAANKRKVFIERPMGRQLFLH